MAKLAIMRQFEKAMKKRAGKMLLNMDEWGGGGAGMLKLLWG